MFGLIATGVAVALSTGAAVKVVLDRMGGTKRITRIELIAGAAAVTLAICPLTAFLGSKIAVSSNSTFHEYWGGWETDTQVAVNTCTRDGSCRHTYECDQYWVSETYYTTDSKGNSTAHTRMVSKYHQCPVGTEEADYTVLTTVGDSTISSAQFTPNTRPWRAGLGLGDTPTTPPEQWVAAKERLAADNAGPATSVHDYPNWVLASQTTVLHRYSSAIDSYRTAKLLPAPSAGVRDGYMADKAHFVGWKPTAALAAQWQDAVARTGAALGTQKQGDLQVVLVNSSKVTDPDEFTGALMAAWQDPEMGRDALAKNTVVLIAGTTDGKTVAWARIATGMPVGNAGLEVSARADLVGVAWTPLELIGSPQVKVRGEKVTAVATAERGALESLLWSPTDGFVRVSMNSDGTSVGYDYLKGELKPTTGQNVAIWAVMVALSGAVWAAVAAVGDTRPTGSARYPNRTTNRSLRDESTRRFEAANRAARARGTAGRLRR